MPARVASTRRARRTSGSRRIAISSRAERPSGGLPTRRARASCSSVSSGTSEKSIFSARVRRSLFTTRRPRADDADRLAISEPPYCVYHCEDSSFIGHADAPAPALGSRVRVIGQVQPLGIREDRGRFEERDPVLLEIADRLPRIPLEHSSVYT